jgi:hypothetical protein
MDGTLISDLLSSSVLDVMVDEMDEDIDNKDKTS